MNTFLLLKFLRRKHGLVESSPRKYKNKRSSASINVNNFNTMCRLCKSSSRSKMIPIFKGSSVVDSNIGVIVKLLENVTINADDGLPQNICDSCFKLLARVKELKERCEKADKEFRDVLRANAANLDCSSETDEFNADESTDVSVQSDVEQTFLDTEDNSIPSANINECLANIDYKVPVRQFDDLFCAKCHVKFDSQSKLIAHSLTAEHASKKWNCIDCNKDFNRRVDYEIHRRSHTHEKPYMCDLCGRGFSYNCSFRKHMFVHKKLFPFKCKSCPHTARSTWAIKIHERTHSGERPHSCPHCPATFSTTSNCKRHVTKHFNARPHKCTQCEKSFFSKQYLHDHKATVHNNVKLYKCSQCDLTMGFKQSLRKHELKVHKSKKKTEREKLVNV